MSDRPSPTEAGAPHVDVHILPLGKKKGDDSFVEGFRRQGPEGLTRELVVLEVDEKGAGKVADKVRQLLDKKLTAFVVDMSHVPALEGATLRDFARAKKLAEEKGGYFSIAGAKEAVAGLLKVMGLEKEIVSHASVATAIEQFRWHLQTQIASKTGAAPAPSAPLPSPAPSRSLVTGEMVAARPEGRLAVEQIDGDFLFYPPGKKPAKKDMAGDTMMLALSVRPNNVEGLAEEVRRAVAAGTNRILANLFELGASGESSGGQLAAAVRAAEEKKARIVFSGASPETQRALVAAGVPLANIAFESEVAAAEQLAVELLEQKNKKGVRLKRIQGEIDMKAVAAAAANAAALGAAQDASEERKPAKTMQMAVPVFDEEPQERKPAKTVQMAAPRFDEEEEAERKPGKTVQMAAPKFDEDEEGERKPGKTQMYSAPRFDEEEDAERKPGKTQMVAAPVFFEEDSSSAIKTADAPSVQKVKTDPERPALKQPEGKAKTDPERPAMRPDAKGKTDPERPAAGFQEMKTQAMAGLSKEEALKLAAEALGKPLPPQLQKARTDPVRPSAPPPAGPQGARQRTEPMRAAAPVEGIQEAKTQAIAGLSREEALRLAAEASGKAAPAPKPKTDPSRPAAAPPVQQPKQRTEPMRSAAPPGIQEAKTQAMAGLSKEEALRLAAQASGTAAPAGAKEDSKPQKTEVMKAFVPAELPAEAERPQKTEVMKAYTPAEEGKAAPDAADLRVMKTEAMPGLTKEEAMRLAAEAAGKGAGRPPSKPEIKAQKTEVLKAPPPEGAVSQVAKTEMLAGLSKEEALRLAAEASGKPVPPGKGGPPGKKSGEAKVKTESVAAAAPVQKTEQLKAFVPSPDEGTEMRTAKTEAMPGLTREEALKLASGDSTGGKSGREAPPKGGGTAPMLAAFPTEAAAKSDQQSMKTEAMPGLSRAEAERLAKGGEVDLQESKTDRMAGLDKDAARREVDRIQFQDSKTQALPGLTREQAEREAGGGPTTSTGTHAAGAEAEAKRSPTLAVIVVLLVVGVVAAFFALKPPADDQAGQVDPKKLEAAEKSIETALEDALDLEGD